MVTRQEVDLYRELEIREAEVERRVLKRHR